MTAFIPVFLLLVVLATLVIILHAFIIGMQALELSKELTSIEFNNEIMRNGIYDHLVIKGLSKIGNVRHD